VNNLSKNSPANKIEREREKYMLKMNEIIRLKSMFITVTSLVGRNGATSDNSKNTK